jgi:hypothetical protein
MKLQKVSQSVSSFAGISFIHEEFNKCGLLQHTDEQPGKRNASGYGHGELFMTWFEIFFCGGEVAEAVLEHLRPTSESIPGSRSGYAASGTKRVGNGRYDRNLFERERVPVQHQ